MRNVHSFNLERRCGMCGLHLEICLCRDLPVFAPALPLVFLQHVQEATKPTNTARLACRILSTASILPWDRTAPPSPGPGAILLYPLEGAPPLTAEDLVDHPAVFVPDGTWAQGSRMANVLSHRPGWTARRLPDGILARWSVRRSGAADRVSTAQAAASVLEIAGEHVASECLLATLEEVGTRLLRMRGVMPSHWAPAPSLPPRPW
jgi:DTW domain-containing protein YfiP